MARIHCNFSSTTLKKDTDFIVTFPHNKSGSRVLYLLHGLSDNYSNWSRNTSVERYADEHNYIVIMPDAGRSFYTDMAYGLPYYTYLTEELPEYIDQNFKVNQSRENTFIAGLSMGGYGAFKIALRNPDKFCAAASFSGVLDVASRFGVQTNWDRDIKLICGDKDIRGSEEDLIALLDRYKDGSLNKPRLYQACGTEDFLYQDNLTFKSKVENMGFDYTYEEGPGTHNWAFWDKHIKRALEFFDENK